MPGLYTHTTRADGLTLTAAIYNADHQNHINNQTPQKMDDYSADAATMQTQTDPGESGSESLATTLAGELERLRYAIAEMKGKTYWYETASTDLAQTAMPGTTSMLYIDRTAAGTVDIDADYAVVFDGTKTVLLSSVDLTVDITASGANGLDTGAEASDTWYYLFIIYNATTTTTAGLMSTSATSPTMPSGYDYKALVGAIRNDDSSVLVPTRQVGNRAWIKSAQANGSIIASGLTSTTWDTQNIATGAPTLAAKFRAIQVHGKTTATGDDTLILAWPTAADEDARIQIPLNLNETNWMELDAAGKSHDGGGWIPINPDGNTLRYKLITGNATTLYCGGWEWNLPLS
jgi:hypothetical protein